MDDKRTKRIIRATLIGSIVNLFLTGLKLLAGFFGRSTAMMADGIHSLSDLISDIVVMVFVRIASREKDSGHEYGHGKFETLASVIISIMLLIVAVKLFHSGICQIQAVLKGTDLTAPSWYALAAAAVSIVSKEWLYRYNLQVGKEEKSIATQTNAWHHRTDAFSSVAAFIGLSGAMLLGGKWLILDPLVCCGISFFIVFIALKMLFPSFAELMDSSLLEDEETEIKSIIGHVKGIRNVHELKTRRSGQSIIIDTHIVVNPRMSVLEAHDLATQAEKALRDRFGEETQISIHVEPAIDAQ